MDLRFIPEDMNFEDDSRDSATEVPSGYEPRVFVCSAMQQSSVKLTWYVTAISQVIHNVTQSRIPTLGICVCMFFMDRKGRG